MNGGQANVEYFFRLLYELFFGRGGGLDFASFKTLLAQAWFWVTIIGYGLSVAGMFIIVYSTTRLFELRRREEDYYKTLIVTPDSDGGANQRWEHIGGLVEGSRPAEWREAIMEADIMLEEVLVKQGYEGEGVGEKLKNASFATIDEAWEAHKVRNQIAHEGSMFDLSESLARRTIQRYETVFREFGVI